MLALMIAGGAPSSSEVLYWRSRHSRLLCRRSLPAVAAVAAEAAMLALPPLLLRALRPPSMAPACVRPPSICAASSREPVEHNNNALRYNRTLRSEAWMNKFASYQGLKIDLNFAHNKQCEDIMQPNRGCIFRLKRMSSNYHRFIIFTLWKI